MSSTSDNQPANQPRVVDYIEGGKLTKAEFLEFMSLRGKWDNESLEILLEFVEQNIPHGQTIQMPYFERLRERHLAEGTISNEQNEILKTVQKKIQLTTRHARVAQYTIQAFVGEEAASQISVSTLHDKIRRRAILFLEQHAIQRAHQEWMEHFAWADPSNIADMIQDAQEFPVPPWNPETTVPAEPAEKPAQPEQGEKTEQIVYPKPKKASIDPPEFP
ncbi:hypothetical protein FHL15_009112 [Xylaria flabelliformis]|uniref:Uncharacterized protein n=1 Tax=Xylaria flabelliformis TaxID=2512241 RepID=A0A553HPY2_9PEZI|nr:hypothetical protein FHL15_009112 [Xylaria flabelliformis]